MLELFVTKSLRKEFKKTSKFLKLLKHEKGSKFFSKCPIYYSLINCFDIHTHAHTHIYIHKFIKSFFSSFKIFFEYKISSCQFVSVHCFLKLNFLSHFSAPNYSFKNILLKCKFGVQLFLRLHSIKGSIQFFDFSHLEKRSLTCPDCSTLCDNSGEE